MRGSLDLSWREDYDFYEVYYIVLFQEAPCVLMLLIIIHIFSPL